MKLKKLNKTQNLIHLFKFFIFALVMLAPIGAIATKVAYVTFNKNAYESYSGTYYYEKTTNIANYLNDNNIEISTATVEGHNYYYYNNEIFNNKYENVNLTFQLNANTKSLFFNVDSFIYKETEYKNKLIFIRTFTNRCVLYYIDNTNFNISNSYYYDNNIYINNTRQNLNIIEENTTGFKFSYTALDNYMYFVNNNSSRFQVLNTMKYTTFVKDDTLSSVFYSAISELSTASIFSWTTDTILYGTINNMITGLGINSDPISVLLTYWMYITLIYIVVDIVIEVIIYMTHAIQLKGEE